jgi:hypothetical protein
MSVPVPRHGVQVVRASSCVALIRGHDSGDAGHGDGPQVGSSGGRDVRLAFLAPAYVTGFVNIPPAPGTPGGRAAETPT